MASNRNLTRPDVRANAHRQRDFNTHGNDRVGNDVAGDLQYSTPRRPITGNRADTFSSQTLRRIRAFGGIADSIGHGIGQLNFQVHRTNIGIRLICLMVIALCIGLIYMMFYKKHKCIIGG